MPISSSVLVRDNHLQADGYRYVKELHTDSEGVSHMIGPYKVDGAESQATSEARMAARVAEMDASLADSELERLIGS